MKALVHNTKVVQVASESFPVHASMQWLDCPGECTTAWTYAGGQFVAPASEPSQRIEDLRATAILGPVELGEKLEALGMFDQVNTWANAQGGQISWAWNRATQFERLHPMVLAAQTEFEWSDAQVDAIFNVTLYQR